ncbi:hypothetical protein VTN77DRAFT_4469 [Rasamsonia byssochlamydoides]|uniref:uncharacterized protein n=1 Tax=Rasamsonia byssochlamydoides TaxID=89139 RepID=UPI00374417D0
MSNLFFFLSVGVLAALFPSTPQAASRTFNLYAYGDAVGGLPLLYQDGYAYVANTTDNSTFTSIYFTESANSSTTWIAHPNTTLSPNATFTSQMLAIPIAESASRQVGFVSGETATENKTIPDFRLYGKTVFVVSSSGAWETLFFAGTTANEGVWTLLWDPDDPNDAGVFPVALRTTPPSN